MTKEQLVSGIKKILTDGFNDEVLQEIADQEYGGNVEKALNETAEAMAADELLEYLNQNMMPLCRIAIGFPVLDENGYELEGIDAAVTNALIENDENCGYSFPDYMAVPVLRKKKCVRVGSNASSGSLTGGVNCIIIPATYIDEDGEPFLVNEYWYDFAGTEVVLYELSEKDSEGHFEETMAMQDVMDYVDAFDEEYLSWDQI